jgi:hypothetical protein
MNSRYLTAAAGFVFAIANQVVGQTQPAQPQDPTQQSPATHAPSPSQRRGLPAEEARPNSAGESPSPAGPAVKARPFMGTIVHRQAGYFLRAGDLEYKLDDSTLASKFNSRSVKVLGNLERQNNTIHVQTIEPSPAP